MTPQSVVVLAGTGSRFIVLRATETSSQLPVFYTPDTGTTWQELPQQLKQAALSYAIAGFGGKFVGLLSTSEGWVKAQLWDPEVGTISEFAFDAADIAESSNNPLSVADFVGSTVVTSDGRVFDLRDGAAVRLPAAFPASSLPVQAYGLSEDAGTVVRGTFGQPDADGSLTTIPLRGAGAPRTVALPHLLGMDVTGSDVHYLVGSTKALRTCTAPVSDVLQATCTVLARGDYRASKYFGTLTTSAGADQVYVVSRPPGSDSEQWLVADGRAIRASDRWTWLPLRDTQAPIALIHSAAAEEFDTAATIDSFGSPSLRFGAPGAAVNVSVLAMAAGRVLSMKDRYMPSDAGTTVVSSWPVNEDGTVGPPVDFSQPVLGAVVASAARTAVRWDPLSKHHTQTDFYDSGTRTGTTTGGYRDALELSGPYAKVGTRVVRVDGRVYKTSPVLAIFGSLVVQASSQKEVAGRNFQIRDLAAPGTPPVQIDLPQPAGRVYLNNSHLTGNNSWRLRGDWVAARYKDTGDKYGSLAFNLRTHQLVDLDTGDGVGGLGEGWIMHCNADDGLLSVLNLGTGEQLGVKVGYDTHAVLSDLVDTISWAGEHSLDIVRLEGLPIVAPRLLGVLAAPTIRRGTASWKPQFDLTKAVKAGSLEISTTDGRRVTSLTTEASSVGSLRNVGWDGRDATGSLVPAGTYTWTLNVTAADGSGAAMSIDGEHSPTGRVQVDG